MTHIGTICVLKQDQFVAVRKRRYTVSQVVQSTLPPEGIERSQPLVALTAAQGDALGKEWRVIWELEPGAHLYDQVVLSEPTPGLDSPLRFDAFRDTLPWGAASSAGARALQAPLRSGINIEKYPLARLARAVHLSQANLLIAGDGGFNQDRSEASTVRRLKLELLPRWDGTPRFSPRRLKAAQVPYLAVGKEVHPGLPPYTRLRQKVAPHAAKKSATEFGLKLPKKRLILSLAAFAVTLAQHLSSLSSATRPGPAPSRLRTLLLTILREQIVRATKASPRPDSETQALINWLYRHIKPQDARSDERVIIFTEYRTTQNWRQMTLTAQGLTSSGRVETLYGGMDPEKWEQEKAAFYAHPHDSPVRILLATGAASEGVDLQGYCHRLIQMDLPWNPNRLEQCSGRIDRYDQHHSPLVFHITALHPRSAQTPDEIAQKENDPHSDPLCRAKGFSGGGYVFGAGAVGRLDWSKLST